MKPGGLETMSYSLKISPQKRRTIIELITTEKKYPINELNN